MTVKVKHKIGDTVVHKVSKKAFLVIGYKYTESLGVEYIITGDDEKTVYAIGFELEGENTTNLGFIYE